VSGSLVLLAYHYPPLVGPASERAASFARHLPELGWEPTVITARSGLYHRRAGHEGPPARVVRTRSPEPTRLLRRLRGAGEGPGEALEPALAGRTGLDRARRFVRDYAYVPDAQAPWIPFARRAARREAGRGQDRTVLMSTSVPYSAHLAARAVARRDGVPWIAELRDPWSLQDDRVRPRSRARRRLDAAMEARVVADAAGVVVTTEGARGDMLAAHPALEGRIWVVRNGFEPASGGRPAPPGPEGPMVLVHAGTVPADAPVEALLRALDGVARSQPGGLLLRVVGPEEPWRTAATGLGGLDWLALDGVTDPAAAREAVAGASACLLLRPGEWNRHIVAAKLLDYLGGRRPVLAVVDPLGEMAMLGAEYGDLRIAGPSEAAIGTAAGALVDEHRRGRLQRPVSGARPLEELSRRSQAEKLARILEIVA
jgi:hypothetical protein